MAEYSESKEVVICNPQGLHARPAHAFVTVASQFDAHVELHLNGEAVDGKSILSILTLGAAQGTRLTIRATGGDAREALAALSRLVEQGFEESVADTTTETAGSDAGGEKSTKDSP
jgi:phosphotransferase system HPr (HPr) family protein